MWLIVQLLMIGVSLLLIIKAVRQTEYLPLIFVILAIWMRFVLSSLHQFTYPPLFAGFSINALASIGVAFIGLLLSKRYLITSKYFILLYLFLIVMCISGLLNGELKGLINNLVKWLYFLSLTLLMCDSYLKEGKDKSLYLLSYPFFLPIALQLLSIPLGQAKATEGDGSVSFIGGYNHEAAFSMILITYVFIVAMIEKPYAKLNWLKILIAVFGLLLANYRTSMIAVLPLILFYIWLKPAGRLNPKDRMLAITFMAFVVGSLLLLVSGQLAERFADIGIVLSEGDKLFINPYYYSDDYKKLFSARVYIWSQYVYAYYQGGFLQHLFGFGPESWSVVFNKYAHNTFISALYELGVVGLFILLLFIIKQLYLVVVSVNGISKFLMIGMIVGFILLNLATMPLWNIEGLITFSVLVSQVYYIVVINRIEQIKATSV
ncbi:O-antigen ligase family protein [Neptunomonas phycophila]|uniref:O-antigen ligase family protein n=1 Tax=Neptunomonas phycophila TaxID=1572645 RepID=A0ABT9ESV0_9GAMM|nr:O-antigen ligase family protein [Neptunomonas phycophila]MDP2522044.1 O-antigen ligase family protein [Neptunomonas phycophila]